MVTVSTLPQVPTAVPHTAAVSAVAVLRGRNADAMYPIKVVVPWEHLGGISRVSLTFRTPPGFDAEVVMVEPSHVLCERRTIEDASLDGSAAPLAAGVQVVVSSSDEPFPCGVKFTDRAGTAGALVGESGETLAFQAFSRLYVR